jgi:hypothetical protein
MITPTVNAQNLLKYNIRATDESILDYPPKMCLEKENFHTYALTGE